MSFKVCFHIMIRFLWPQCLFFETYTYLKTQKIALQLTLNIDVKSLLIWRLQSFLLIKNLGDCGIKKWLE